MARVGSGIICGMGTWALSSLSVYEPKDKQGLLLTSAGKTARESPPEDRAVVGGDTGGSESERTWLPWEGALVQPKRST